MTLRQTGYFFEHSSPLEADEVALEEAVFRLLAEPLQGTQSLPAFTRSTMDRFAVKPWETFGVTVNLPALLNLCADRGRP